MTKHFSGQAAECDVRPPSFFDVKVPLWVGCGRSLDGGNQPGADSHAAHILVASTGVVCSRGAFSDLVGTVAGPLFSKALAERVAGDLAAAGYQRHHRAIEEYLNSIA